MMYFFLLLFAAPDCTLTGGSVTVYDHSAHRWIYTDSTNAFKESQPASTFKIINLLIALETGVIKDEMAVVKWPGKTDTSLYGYRPDIYKDITVKEAFEVSAGWAFIELAKKIGRKQYARYLKASEYGNQDLSEKGDDFWNFGNFKISPVNQIQFLTKVYEGKTPFSKRNTDILKRVMITEQKPQYTIRSKTGWTRIDGKDIGWWTGYVEREGKAYFFATRLERPRENSGNWPCRKEITYKVLRGLKIID
jgi:beta-lactamase class D